MGFGLDGCLMATVFDACGDPRIWVHFWVSVSSYGLEEEESNRKTSAI